MITRDKKRKERENPIEEKNPSYGLKKEKEDTQVKARGSTSHTQMFDRVTIESGGNCLFRAILYCLCGEDSSHMTLRGGVCNYLNTLCCVRT